MQINNSYLCRNIKKYCQKNQQISRSAHESNAQGINSQRELIQRNECLLRSQRKSIQTLNFACQFIQSEKSFRG